MRTYAKKIDPDEARRRDLAGIHILKKQAMENCAGFGDDNYRDMIWEIGKVGSSSELDEDQRLALIRRLSELAPEQQPRRAGGDLQDQKIRSTWLELHAHGIIRNPSDMAMRAFIRRVTGKDALAWCTVTDKQKVIEGLKNMGSRL